LSSFVFDYNLKDIYFKRHVDADPKTKVTLIIGNTDEKVESSDSLIEAIEFRDGFEMRNIVCWDCGT
jgi:hypothetical protein